MDAKAFLEQYISTGNAIDSLVFERERVFELAKRAKAAKRDNNDPVGKNAPRLEDIDKDIEEEIKKFTQLRRVVEETIYSIEDVRIRDVLRYRYLAGLSVEATAKKMFYSERWCKELQKRGMELIEEKCSP